MKLEMKNKDSLEVTLEQDHTGDVYLQANGQPVIWLTKGGNLIRNWIREDELLELGIKLTMKK